MEHLLDLPVLDPAQDLARDLARDLADGAPSLAARVDAALRAQPYGVTNAPDNKAHLLSVAATLPFLRGEFPAHWSGSIDRLTRTNLATPTNAIVLRDNRNKNRVHRLVVGDGWVAYVNSDDNSTWLSISALDHAVIDAVRAELRQHAAPKPAVDTGSVGMTFTYLGVEGPVRRWRAIEASRWSDTAQNYPADVRVAADALATMSAETKPDGRIVLLYGPPGTGKSSLVRTLADAWRSWCDVEIIVDPEHLFDKSAYLFSAVLQAEDEDEYGEHDEDADDQRADERVNRVPRWRMFVLEGCDELLRGDARERSGQALSRLLNVADGIVGQGLRVLFCLSTNADVRSLHPALVRPGRCLARVEVGRFPTDEANAWLRSHESPIAVGQEASLAELYGLAAGRGPVQTAATAARIGQYLGDHQWPDTEPGNQRAGNGTGQAEEHEAKSPQTATAWRLTSRCRSPSSSATRPGRTARPR